MRYSPNHSIFSIPERRIAGKSILTNADNDRVRVDWDFDEEGTPFYRVMGLIPLGRTAITDIMTAPLRIEDADWSEVQRGLRAVSRPSKGVEAVHREGEYEHTSSKAPEGKQRPKSNGAQRNELQSLRPASRELADILTQNQTQQSETVNVPVFDWKSADRYALQDLFFNTDPHTLIDELQASHADKATIRRLQEFISHPTTALRHELRELERITNIPAIEQRLMENSQLLAAADARVIVSLLYNRVDKMFQGFKESAQFVNPDIRGGGFEETVKLRASDVPKALAHQAGDVRLTVGPAVRDRERLAWERKEDRERLKKEGKPSGLERRAVTFSTEKTGIAAYPLLMWRKRGGKRELLLPTSPLDRGAIPGPVVHRPSSLLGAALVANYFGVYRDISYEQTLERMIQRRDRRERNAPPLARAGLLPLVIHHREHELLDDEYFTSVEEAVK